MITFEKPWMLLLILFIFPCTGYTLFRIRKIRLLYGGRQPDMMLRIAGRRTAAWVCGWICLSLAAAIPVWGSRQTVMTQKGSAVIFAVDISRSMTVSDIQPSRLEFAKQYIAFIISKLPQTSCGLVLIKGTGILAVPLSFNHQSLLTALKTLSPLSATASGSNLEQAVLTALHAFPPRLLNSKTVVLCTDGEETIGSLVRTAGQVKRAGVKVVSVGFGTAEGASLSVLTELQETEMHRTRLEDTVLQTFSERAGGGSFYLSAVEKGSVWRVIQAVEGTHAEKVQTVETPVRRVFECSLAALIFFCAGFLAGGLYGKRMA